MDLSLFLARLLGIFLLILAAIWIVRKEQFVTIAREFLKSRELLYFLGIFDLLAGLAIAIGHPVWELNWKGLITLIGYIFIFRGILRMAFTEKVQKWALKLISKNNWIYISILIILGLYLTISSL